MQWVQDPCFAFCWCFCTVLLAKSYSILQTKSIFRILAWPHSIVSDWIFFGQNSDLSITVPCLHVDCDHTLRGCANSTWTRGTVSIKQQMNNLIDMPQQTPRKHVETWERRLENKKGNSTLETILETIAVDKQAQVSNGTGRTWVPEGRLRKYTITQNSKVRKNEKLQIHRKNVLITSGFAHT